MKRLVIVTAAVIGVVFILIAALPFLVPSSVYKTQIEKAASDALGREVIIEGNARLSIFPVISASVENVTVANLEGFDEPSMIEASALRGSVRLFPLFSRRVEVNELTFEDAEIRLTRLKDGTVNWTFGDDTAPAPQTDPATGKGGDPFSASIKRASLRNASLVFEDRAAGTLYKLTELDAETSLTSADKPLNLRARGKFQAEPFELNVTLTTPQAIMDGMETSIDARLGSSLGNVSFDGQLVPGEALTLTGQFSADIPQISRLTDFVAVALPFDVAPLGGVRASGKVDGGITTPNIRFDELVVSGEGLNASYTGTVRLNNEPFVDGNLSLAVRDAFSLSQEMGIDQPMLAPLRQVTADAKLQGAITALALSAMDIRATSPSLSATYSGLISLDGDGRLDGNVSIKSEQLRRLLEQVGIDLPDADNLNSASVAGRTTGSFQHITVQSGTFVLDETQATGTVAADIGTPVPSIRADLTLAELDLSPFLGEGAEKSSNAEAAPGQWSAERLDLDGLNAFNADMNLKAGKVVLGDIVLRDSDIQAVITNGKLIATLNKVSAFGGNWTGEASVDAALQRPEFTFNLAAESVQAKDLLAQTAGFEKLSGDGLLNVDISTVGGSIQEIASALNGTLSLDLENGVLTGLNLGQLVRTTASLQQLIAAGDVNVQSLGNVVSPQAQTDFTTFSTSLNVKDGVAQLQGLTLANSVLDVTGTGQIDLGKRSLDVRLVPAVDRSGQGTNTSSIQVSGVPIPLRIHGSWLTPRFSPDLSGVRSTLTATAREKAARELKDSIGGDLGSIVSDAVTGGKTDAAPTTAAQDADTEEVPSPDTSEGSVAAEAAEDTEQPENEDDPREKALKQVLGTIFNQNE